MIVWVDSAQIIYFKLALHQKCMPSVLNIPLKAIAKRVIMLHDFDLSFFSMFRLLRSLLIHQHPQRQLVNFSGNHILYHVNMAISEVVISNIKQDNCLNLWIVARSAIPEDGRRKAYAEALAKAKAEEEAIKASEQARGAAEAARRRQEEVKKLEKEEARVASLAAEAQNKAEAAGASVESFLNKAKGLTSEISWESLSSQLKSAVQKPDEEPKVQLATVRGQAKARSLPSLKAVVKNPARQTPSSKSKDIPKPKAKVTEPEKETRKVFGGLFQQETIYINDD